MHNNRKQKFGTKISVVKNSAHIHNAVYKFKWNDKNDTESPLTAAILVQFVRKKNHNARCKKVG